MTYYSDRDLQEWCNDANQKKAQKERERYEAAQQQRAYEERDRISDRENWENLKRARRNLKRSMAGKDINKPGLSGATKFWLFVIGLIILYAMGQ